MLAAREGKGAAEAARAGSTCACVVVARARVQRLPQQEPLPPDVLRPVHAWWRLTAGREGR